MIISELREIEEHLRLFETRATPPDGMTEEQTLAQAQLAIRNAKRDVKTHRHYHNDTYADSLEGVLKVTQAVYLRLQDRCPEVTKRPPIEKEAYSETTPDNIPLVPLEETELPNELWDTLFSFTRVSEWQALRKVNRTYLKLSNDFLRLRWEHLKRSPPPGFVDFGYLMQRIENEFPNHAHLVLFKELKREFVRLGATIAADQLPTTAREFDDLQRQFGPEYEKSLCAFRDYLILHLTRSISGLTAQQFQAWMNDPNNGEELNRLITIDLNHGDLTIIPYEIRQFKKLKMLHLNDNKLSRLPKEIGALRELKILKLNSNQLQSLPQEIGKLTAMTHLFLENNQLQFLPQEIKALIKLKFLFLQQNQLQSLPNEIGALESLEGLHLTGNQLSSIPPSFGSLSNLKKCIADNNKLLSVPKEIGKCISLEELCLNSNQLSSLPQEFSALGRLFKLHLTHNQFQTFPEAICSLAGLHSLSLDYNQLLELPAEIAGLKSLRTLFLEGNQLATLPSELSQLKNLRSVIISHNKFKVMPAALTSLQLHACFYEGNLLG